VRAKKVREVAIAESHLDSVAADYYSKYSASNCYFAVTAIVVVVAEFVFAFVLVVFVVVVEAIGL
jgi:nitrous oxide reductase